MNNYCFKPLTVDESVSVFSGCISPVEEVQGNVIRVVGSNRNLNSIAL